MMGFGKDFRGCWQTDRVEGVGPVWALSCKSTAAAVNTAAAAYKAGVQGRVECRAGRSVYAKGESLLDMVASRTLCHYRLSLQGLQVVVDS
jgi:hypothetical protein